MSGSGPRAQPHPGGELGCGCCCWSGSSSVAASEVVAASSAPLRQFSSSVLTAVGCSEPPPAIASTQQHAHTRPPTTHTFFNVSPTPPPIDTQHPLSDTASIRLKEHCVPFESLSAPTQPEWGDYTSRSGLTNTINFLPKTPLVNYFLIATCISFAILGILLQLFLFQSKYCFVFCLLFIFFRNREETEKHTKWSQCLFCFPELHL